MLVKNIMADAALLLNRSDVATYISDGTSDDATDSETQKNLLLYAYNNVIDEIASEYYPLKITETHEPESGIVNFSDLTYNLYSVLSVKDIKGNNVDYQLFSDRLECDCPFVVIEYCRAPEAAAESDNCILDNSPIGARIIAYGLASEYCLMRGRFEEAELWQNRYQDGLEGALFSKKKLKIKARRWF